MTERPSNRLWPRALPAVLMLLATGVATSESEVPPRQPELRSEGGKTISLYGGSYALVIGVSEYKGIQNNGWRPLTSRPTEITTRLS